MSDISGEGPTHKKVVVRPKPTLVTIGDREVISTGRWNDQVMADYVTEHGQDKWITVGKLASVGCAANTIANKKRVRAKLSGLFMVLCQRGLFLAIEYSAEHKAASAVKVADPRSSLDVKLVQNKLDRMLKYKEMSKERYDSIEAQFRKKWQ